MASGACEGSVDSKPWPWITNTRLSPKLLIVDLAKNLARE